ncbi:hypothetical protein C1645_737479 [Glomus cerebriforme]|uniref:Uncharacterized protein n=1 Tax=Glomus cerebriforme TaxID=658196 RepID=A0A397SZC4_9GLOM|nr:hypothetical protein C1645_737479 [Glomus cerebriforme]
MELILLLLGKKASRCSIAVNFLPTSPPEFRSKAVKPIWMILEQENTDPYYENAIEKYFKRPNGHEFDIITYPEYFRKYKIISNQYEIYNIITTSWGSLKEIKKHPFFFITGSAGIVIKICDQENVEVAFPLTDGIKTFTVQKDTVYFTFNDRHVLEEYERLQEIYNKNITSFFT